MKSKDGKEGIPLPSNIFLDLAEIYGGNPSEIEFGWESRYINLAILKIQAQNIITDERIRETTGNKARRK